MYPRLTYFLGGAAAAIGVLVTVTDPNILENVTTFPKRVTALFQDEKPHVFDVAAAKIILEGRLRKMFEYSLDIPDHSKDQLAAHFAGECLKGADQFSSVSDMFESQMVTLGLNNDDKIGSEFGTISKNIAASISNLPDLVTGCSYRVGITLGFMGELGTKDYVENPSQTPLKHGVIRLTAGGGLFALPIVLESMQNSIEDGVGPANIMVDKVGSGLKLE